MALVTINCRMPVLLVFSKIYGNPRDMYPQETMLPRDTGTRSNSLKRAL